VQVRTRRITLAVAVVAVAALGVASLAGASLTAKAGSPKTVAVTDNLYTPTKVKVKKRARVRWDWGQDFNSHNVTLKKGPSGVRKSKFRSQTTSDSDYTWTKRFTKVGKYHYYCTIHPTEMNMTVVVHR
jgi:plastocyanin